MPVQSERRLARLSDSPNRVCAASGTPHSESAGYDDASGVNKSNDVLFAFRAGGGATLEAAACTLRVQNAEAGPTLLGDSQRFAKPRASRERIL
jgi:hypothetical protein